MLPVLGSTFGRMLRNVARPRVHLWENIEDKGRLRAQEREKERVNVVNALPFVGAQFLTFRHL